MRKVAIVLLLAALTGLSPVFGQGSGGQACGSLTEVLVDLPYEDLDAAEEAFRVAEELYEVGASTSLELLDFERERMSAEVEYSRALHEYSIALAALKRTIEIPVYESFHYTNEPGG